MHFESNGKSYQLRYNFNSLALLEDVLGVPVTAVGDNPGIKEIRALLWAGLLHQHKDLSLNDAGDIADGVGFSELPELVSTALSKALTPETKKK